MFSCYCYYWLCLNTIGLGAMAMVESIVRKVDTCLPAIVSLQKFDS